MAALDMAAPLQRPAYSAVRPGPFISGTTHQVLQLGQRPVAGICRAFQCQRDCLQPVASLAEHYHDATAVQPARSNASVCRSMETFNFSCAGEASDGEAEAEAGAGGAASGGAGPGEVMAAG